MRAKLAIIIIKLTKWALSLFGRGGSMPGAIALKIEPNLLRKLVYPQHVIIITGTNGKTTTTNQLYEVLKNSGLKTISNLKGDNMKIGIATLLGANTGLDLKIRADAVVLETDELNVPLVINEMKTSAFIVNNLFRDQGDRLGSIDRLVERIGSSLKDYTGSLFLNGNDANVSRFAYYAPNAKVSYFGVDENTLSTISDKEASEGKFCPICGAKLTYAFYNYAHMGPFVCPTHDFGGFSIQTKAKHVDMEDGSFEIMDERYTSPQNAMYAIYNCCAIIAYATSIHITPQIIKDTFQSFEFRGGRTEVIRVHNKPVTMMLIKNPTGANETMKFIEKNKDAKAIVIIVNDAEGDGRDVSWYWDANFELIMQEDVKHVICSGIRAYDMALRFQNSDYAGDLIVLEDPKKAIDTLCSLEATPFIMANYTALAPARAIVERMAS